MKKSRFAKLTVLFIVFASVLSAGSAFAHCDGLDGPVVKAARKALETSNVNLVLIWVKADNEAEVKHAFENTVAVRKLNDQAKDLADMYFFETLVRLHRAGEGAAYTGLKPAGRDLGPVIPAADKAIDVNSVKPLEELMTKAVQEGINERFKHVMEKKNFKSDDVKAGREYVRAYVEFVHYVEQIHLDAEGKAALHAEPGEAAAHTEHSD